MGFLNYRTTRIVLGSQDGVDWWVDMRELTQGDAGYVESKLTHGVKITEQGGTIPDGVVNSWRLEQVARSIVDWNLTDENEQRLPVYPLNDLKSSLKQLPARVFAILHDTSEELNKQESDAESVRFPEPTVGGSVGADDNGHAPDPERVPSETVVLDGAGDGL